MAKIQIVTDSAADIPADLLAEHSIKMLPFPIIIDDHEYLDGVDFPGQKFYEVLTSSKTIPTHSQLTAFYFTELYAEAFEDGCEELIYVSINAKASSTYQNALQAIDLFYEEQPEAKGKLRITVLDAKTYTMAYGFIVVEAAKAVENGASAEEVIALIQDWLAHVAILFTPYDLKFAKKSGRVRAAAAVLGDTLGIHPIMAFPDGDSKVVAKVRGDKAVIPNILKRVQKERKPGTPYLHIKGSYEAWNEEMAAACAETLGEDPALSYYIGGVISINSGPNVTGLIYYKAD